MCTVAIEYDINSVIAYTVLHNNVSTVLETPFMSFQPLTLADRGIYQCTVEITSPYINDAIVLMTSPEEQNLTFQCE